METSAPVRGFRPMPVLRGRTLNTPKPRSSMRSPVARAFFILSKTVSTANSALVLVIPVRLTTSLMMSSLITGIPRLPRIVFLKLLMLRGIGQIVNRGVLENGFSAKFVHLCRGEVECRTQDAIAGARVGPLELLAES